MTAAAPAVETVEDIPAPAPAKTEKSDSRPKKQPRYHVVLWNDNDHTYQYVVAMLQKLFGHPPEKGYLICLLYTSPSPRDGLLSRMPSSA